MQTESDIRRIDSGRARLSDNVVGSLTHSVLAELLANDQPLSFQNVQRETDRQLPPDLAVTYRMSIRQKVGAAIQRYDGRFRRQGWTLVAPEVVARDVAFDLLWVSDSGTLEVDEIKAGLNAGRHISSISAQCESQVRSGNEVYGSDFAGVRLVLLAAGRSIYFENPAARGEG